MKEEPRAPAPTAPLPRLLALTPPTPARPPARATCSYDGKQVDQVILPGEAGEFGITAGHTPNITQLKPGVMQILHEKDDKDPETFFISGGFSITHEDSSTSVSAVEAFKLDDLDAAAAQAGFAEAKGTFDTAPEDSAAKAEAQIAMETYAEVVNALGGSVA